MTEWDEAAEIARGWASAPDSLRWSHSWRWPHSWRELWNGLRYGSLNPKITLHADGGFAIDGMSARTAQRIARTVYCIRVAGTDPDARMQIWHVPRHLHRFVQSDMDAEGIILTWRPTA